MKKNKKMWRKKRKRRKKEVKERQIGIRRTSEERELVKEMEKESRGEESKQ